MPIQDQTYSVISLAKTILMGLDDTKFDTRLQTKTLRLILETLINSYDQPAAHKMEQAAQKTVSQRITQVEQEQEAALEAEQKGRVEWKTQREKFRRQTGF